jgi:hypothetical protein
MTKAEFLLIKQTQGVMMAALYANMNKVCLATVQLWIRSKA